MEVKEEELPPLVPDIDIFSLLSDEELQEELNDALNSLDINIAKDIIKEIQRRNEICKIQLKKLKKIKKIEKVKDITFFSMINNSIRPHTSIIEINNLENYKQKLIDMKDWFKNNIVKSIDINFIFISPEQILFILSSIIQNTVEYNIFIKLPFSSKNKTLKPEMVKKAKRDFTTSKKDKSFKIKSYLLLDIKNIQRVMLTGQLFNIRIRMYGKRFFNIKKGGNAFLYINTIAYDLSSLGIYNYININVQPCLIIALITYGVNITSIYNVNSSILSHTTTQNDLHKICDIIKHCIRVTNLYDTKNIYLYGEDYSSNGIIKLILFKEHYFLDYKMPGCIYAFKNYEKTFDSTNYWYYYNRVSNSGGYYMKRNSYTSSRSIVKILYEKGLFRKINMNDKFIYNSEIKLNLDIVSLNYDPKLCAREVGRRTNGTMKKLLYKKIYDINNTVVLYGDFESDPHKKRHMGYLLCIDYSDESKDKLDSLIVNGSIKNKYYTKFAFQRLGMLLNHKYTYIIYFHNLTYDKSFIYDNMVIDKDGYWGKSKGNIKQLIGQVLNNKGKYVKVILKCSYHVIPTALKNFKEWFNLDIDKEIWIVELSTIENINKEWLLISEALYYIKSDKDNTKEERCQMFINNLNKLEKNNKNMYIKKDLFNFKLYTEYYCLRDCKVLKLGMEKWREMVYELSYNNINLYDIITIPQIGYNLSYIEGAFKDIYEFRLHVRDFMSKSTKGGICATTYNVMWKVDIPMEDLDVNGQYGNTMVIMGGISKGLAKVLNINKLYYKCGISPHIYLRGKKSINMLNLLKEYTYSSLEIIIYGVNRKMNIPVMCEKINNINNYNNSYTGKYSCDILELESLILYQKIVWSLVRGYYFDEGRNKGLSYIVEKLITLRDKLKKLKNGMQQMIKLLINSGFFGRMIMKPIRKKYIILYGKENKNNYINRYNKYVKSWIKISGNMYMINTVKSISMHYAIIHGGNNVLSLSKVDMYLIRYICDINKIIYTYTDTDSLHVEHDKVYLLEKKYFEMTNRKLIGNMPGQLSSDYKFNQLTKKGEGKFIYKKGYDHLMVGVACRSYYLAKKVYINQIDINYPDNNNKLIKQIYYHIRCKGIGGQALVKGIMPIHDIYKEIGPMNIYELLYQGFPCKFDLVKGGKISFEYKDDLTVCTRNNYYRIMFYDNTHKRYHIRKDRTIIEDKVIIMNNDNQYILKTFKDYLVDNNTFN